MASFKPAPVHIHAHLAIEDPSKCGRLPDDVLCAIFNVCASLDPPYREETDNEGEVRYSLGWISIGHACRRWRTILLSLSPLWASIICTFPNAAPEIVSRARDAPLSFTNPYMRGGFVQDSLVQLALSHISRVRRLRLGANSRVDAKYRYAINEALTSRPLPLLEEFDVHVYHRPGRSADVYNRSSTGQFDPALRLEAPSLRSFTHCDLFTFTCPMLTSLSTTLWGIDAESYTRHLMDMLRGFPLLRTLSIGLRYGDVRTPGADRGRGGILTTNIPLSISPWTTCMRQPVTLDHLRDAHVSGTPRADVFGFWSCLRTPADTNIELVGLDLAEVIEPACHVLEHQLHDAALDTLVVRCPGELTVGVVLRRSRERRRTAGRHEIGLHTGVCRTEYKEMPGIMRTLVSALRADCIRHLNLLSLENDGYYDDEEMRRALEPLTAVSVVSIHASKGVGGILRMLRPREDGGAVPFARLDTLVVHMRKIPGEYETWHTECWSALTSVLHQRHRVHVPVREVRITGGWSTESMRSDLAGVESPYLDDVRDVVTVVRDKRIIKGIAEEGCMYYYTDLEVETDEEG
ncbi:unnamed protein product [Peniophora sp. CBMAI 1063]|nr:unnamed protein product [Peniophora sp. CBMAI 1063]